MCKARDILLRGAICAAARRNLYHIAKNENVKAGTYHGHRLDLFGILEFGGEFSFFIVGEAFRLPRDGKPVPYSIDRMAVRQIGGLPV